MIDWLFYQQYHFANACSQGRKKFVIYDGDGIYEWYEIIIFSGKVVSVYLLTDRKHVCPSQQQYWSFFICYLRRGWNFRVVSFIPGKSWILDTDKGPVKPMQLRGGTKCISWCHLWGAFYWLKWDNDWLGAWDNRPVNPMHPRETPPVSRFKRKNRWWGLEHEQFDLALLVVTNCVDFYGYLLFVTVAIVYWLQTREGSIMICNCTSNIFRTCWMIEGHF